MDSNKKSPKDSLREEAINRLAEINLNYNIALEFIEKLKKGINKNWGKLGGKQYLIDTIEEFLKAKEPGDPRVAWLIKVD